MSERRVASVLIACLIAPVILGLAGCGEKIVDEQPVSIRPLEGAEELLDLPLSRDERDLMLDDLADARDAYKDLRTHLLENSVPPALEFEPLAVLDADSLAATLDRGPSRWSDPGTVTRPDDLDDLAWYTVEQLGVLVRTRQVSCVELANLALDRLRRYDPELHCVITLTADRALARAAELDRLLDEGTYLGPLHGIPYGAKDLLSVAGYRTTWGAAPYQDQELDRTATVITKLDAAGAVLVAKLSMGALAMGDVWYGGTTRNPWNLEQGSSGSSAGSAAAVSAGLVPFAIGTETWGSIVSPSTRCGVTGLRPTFGRVSRAGAMALSWSMDTIGPIARTVEDCAVVFDAIRGADRADPTTVAMPFSYRPDFDPTKVRVGYLEEAFSEDGPDSALNAAALETLRDLGVELVPVNFDFETLGVDVYSLAIILSAEAGAAFQELVLTGRDDLLVRQGKDAWPNTFRSAQFIPAVEYIQANRQRTLLMDMMADLFRRVDVYVTPSFGGSNLLVTNLTGQPQVVVPNGFIEPNRPASISFVGQLDDEATVLALAKFYQDATGWQTHHPEGF